MKLTSTFEVIIPVAHSWSSENTTGINTLFQKKTFSNTPQLEGKPIKDPEATPVLGVYELRQVARRTIGLHGNEGHLYKLVRNNLSFQIGKLKLWLFKSGIGFITVRVKTDNLNEAPVLDLVSEICNIRQKTRISYNQSTGRDVFETRVFTLKDVIAKLLGLIGEEYCLQIDGITYNKVFCLFYGTGFTSTEDEMYTFLEMLCNQNKSDRAVSEYHKDAFYRPFKYITWGTSEKVVAVFCDIAAAGEANEQFLTTPGGLIQSVFTNYLLLYLNLLSSNLKLSALEVKYNLFDPHSNNQWSEEAHNEISLYLNSPVVKLSNESHINRLFDEYLYDRTFGLKDKHSNLSNGGVAASIKKTVEQFENQVEYIKGWLDSVSNLVTQRKTNIVEMDGSPEILEKQRSEFINSVATEIARIAWQNTASVDYEAAQLQGMFGDSWYLLDEYTRRSLISAKVFASNCRKTSYMTLDCSGIIVSATSALENELKLRFFIGYQDYLYKKFGNPCADKWPQSMLFRKRNGQVVKNTMFTMGSLSYIFDCIDTDKKSLQNYLQMILSAEYKDKGMSAFLSKNSTGKSFIDRCEDVRNNYRNAAAHTEPVSMEKAEACCVDVIGQQAASNQIGKVQGLLFDLVRITANYRQGGI